MVAANQQDFLGEGTVDPFAGLAPAEDPSTAEAARRLQLQRSATATANINAAPGDYNSSQNAMTETGSMPGTHEQSDAYMREHHLGKYARSLGYNLIRDPVTLGILAAPAAITGLGAVLGGGAALGFGAGTGSIAAGAGEPAVYGAAAGIPAAAAPFSMPAATALGSSALPAAGSGVLGGAAATTAALAPAAASFPWGEVAKDTLAIGGPIAAQQLLGGTSKEDKALEAKQQQLAQEAKVRQGQQQDARMNALGQSLLAFNPTNQMMAQLFGPSAAFTPDQMAQMVQGPAPPQDPNLTNYTGDDQKTLQAKREQIRRNNEYAAAEEQRRNMMMNGISQPPPAAPPMQMSPVQAARKF